MDRSVDPCVDFYAYSCNGWRARNPIPPDKSRWSVYGKLYNENQQFLWGLLEEAARDTGTADPELRKLGDYFAACMDLAKIDKAGLVPIRPDVRTIDQVADSKGIAALLGGLRAGRVDAVVMASAALRGDVVYTTEVSDLEALRAHLPSVRVLGV